MRILFLDVDGVLNRVSGDTDAQYACGQVGAGFLDADLMFQLRRVVRATGCKLVLSSAWRHWYKEPDCSLRHVLAAFGLIVADETPEIGTMRKYLRGEEIAEWLRAHSSAVERYAIVDDDSDMLPEQQARFVRTDERHGLTEADADRLIALLGTEDPTP